MRKRLKLNGGLSFQRSPQRRHLTQEEREPKAGKAEATSTPGTPEALTLYLHSQVLQKHSAFFETLLSERWSAKADFQTKENSKRQLKLKGCSNVKAYARTLRLLYECMDGNLEICKVPRFTDVHDGVDVFQAADHLQIRFLQEYAMDYILAVPWTAEEQELVQSLSQEGMWGREKVLQERLAPGEMSDTFRKKLLDAMLALGGKVDLRSTLMELVKEGAFSRSSLETSIKHGCECFKDDLARYPYPPSDCRDQLLKRLWLLTEIAIESALDATAVVKLLWEPTSSGRNFATEFRRDDMMRRAYLTHFYQHLISVVRQGSATLTLEFRTLVFRQYIPPVTAGWGGSEEIARERQILRDIQAVLSTLPRGKQQEDVVMKWLPDLLKAHSGSEMKDWLRGLLQWSNSK